MVKPKAKITTFSATPRDLEMLEVVARYHGLNKSATLVSLVRKEFWRAFPGWSASGDCAPRPTLL